MIEVEIRSFISEENYHKLLIFFQKEAIFINEDEQETHYFKTPGNHDIRIQQNKQFSKIWLKKGKLHDEQREEIEILCKHEQFPDLQKLFVALDFPVEIKWFRRRHSFKWQDIDVSLDYTKGYGYIIELEKLVSETEKDAALTELKEKMQKLQVPLTSREEFDARYKHYKEHWRSLLQQSI
ncbi:CYTH domain-containing protein [Candidatus Pacearchaeota archaeon]|nr:CYTH domain-containing protein [Candidatus Pacearchaeota archaeon]